MWPEQLKYFPAAHGIACIYRDEPLPDWTPAGLKINVRCPEDIEAAVFEGRCVKADTIDELLAKIDGMDVTKAKAPSSATTSCARPASTKTSASPASACLPWKTARSTRQSAALP